MSASRACPKCGAALPDEGWEGLCPKCLVRVSLEGPAGEATGPCASPFPGSEDGSPSKPKPPIGNPKSQIANPKVRYFGDYELLEEIARGGMGVVYKARQVSLNRLVALKMILSGEFASAEFVQRFRKEAQAAANLHHRNIVSIHEVGVHEGHHYFSMDYVEGNDLGKLAREAALPARQAAGYLKTIAAAIHYAHERGTLHRDLKPSNVIIDQFDEPRVTDFGLAKQINGKTELTLAGQILGSPNFAPPEQAAGRTREIDPRSDVYGLGAILYYLLTGRPPFVTATMQETLALVQLSEPTPMRVLNPGIPRDLEIICLKCLQKKPERRYATASELAEDLGRFLCGDPIRARPVGVVERAWRWCRREPALAQLVATIVVSIFALNVGLALHAASVNRERLKAEYASTLLAQILSSIDIPDPGQLSKSPGVRVWDLTTGRPMGEGKVSLGGNLKVALSAANSNAVLVSDARTGQPVCPPLVHPAQVTSFAFSPDGTFVLTVCADATNAPGAAYLWETKSGRGIAKMAMPLGKDVHTVGFSPDGRRLITESGSIRLWHSSNGHPAAVFSPDGQARLWDASNATWLGTIAKRALPSSVVSARFSPDGRFIITVTRDFGVQIWDGRTGTPWQPSF